MIYNVVDFIKRRRFRVTRSNIGQIVGAEGHVFAVKFIKRTTGEERSMRCFTQVKKHLKGGPAAYDFREKGLLSVWIPVEDRRPGGKDNGYRAIPIEGIREIRANGSTYRVVGKSFLKHFVQA